MLSEESVDLLLREVLEGVHTRVKKAIKKEFPYSDAVTNAADLILAKLAPLNDLDFSKPIILEYEVQKEPFDKPTHLVDNIHTISYRLVEKFGQPSPGDGYKVDYCWYIQAKVFHEGLIKTFPITVYNWKDGPSYEDGPMKELVDIEFFHIGGVETMQHTGEGTLQQWVVRQITLNLAHPHRIES